MLITSLTAKVFKVFSFFKEQPDEAKSAADAGGDLGSKNEAKAAAEQRPEAGMRKKRNELTGDRRISVKRLLVDVAAAKQEQNF